VAHAFFSVPPRHSRPGLEFLQFPATFPVFSALYCGAGAFACQPRLYYRRRLPHWHPDLTEATFHEATFHRRKEVKAAKILYTGGNSTASSAGSAQPG
jgi:hypothetical protein